VHQCQGVAELVGIRQDEREDKQDQGVERRVDVADRVLPSRVRDEEGDEAAERDEGSQDHARPREQRVEDGAIPPPHVPIGAIPVQLEGLDERHHTIRQARAWPKGVGEDPDCIDGLWLEEPFPP
jgi:hypothetical protein